MRASAISAVLLAATAAAFSPLPSGPRAVRRVVKRHGFLDDLAAAFSAPGGNGEKVGALKSDLAALVAGVADNGVGASEALVESINANMDALEAAAAQRSPTDFDLSGRYGGVVSPQLSPLTPPLP